MRDDEDERSGDDDEDRSSLSDLAARVRGDSDEPAGREQRGTDADDGRDRSADGRQDRTGDADAGDRLGAHVGSASHGNDGDEPTLSDLAASIRSRRGAESAVEPDDDLDEWDFVGQDGSGAGAAALDPKTEAVLELAGDASNVLLSGPAGCPADQSLCSRLMASRSSEPVNLLVVTVSETPSQRLSVLQNYLGEPVAETAVVDVRNYNRTTDYDEYEGPVDVRTVSSPQDLRRIGIVASKVLTGWEDGPGQTTVCFHSLSDLLELNDDRERLFRFLHVLRGRIQSAEARAHYHLDPTQHDEEAVRTFESLFETIIEFEEDGSVSLP